MSRLILEGDTTERFGVKYPKPYIEKIVVKDSEIIPHVYVYLQVEEEVNDILQVESLISNLNIVYIFDNKPAIDVLTADYFEFVYSSNGVKYAKIKIGAVGLGAGMTTYDIGYDQISQITEPIYFGAFTYARGQATLYKAPEPTTFDKSGEYKRYEAVASQLSYELIINSDGTPADEVIAYLQTDGNYFGSIPLQSLDRVFRTTENVSHRQVINSVNNVIAPYVGNLTEADNISLILNEYSDNPRLMLELKKEINSFSSKSSSTATGQLYGSLVDVVGDLNSVLEASPRLQKRLVKNSKIIDERSTAAAPYSAEGIYEDGSETMPTYSDNDYIYEPLVSRRIAPLVQNPSTSINDYCVVNESYIFFDYEKALNYESQLSRFLNVYNIQELFGKNCLNVEFRIQQAKAIKSEATTVFFPVKVREITFDVGYDLVRMSTIADNILDVDNEYHSKPLYDDHSSGQEYTSALLPRNLETGVKDYRVLCFYLTDLEQLKETMSVKGYKFEIQIWDRTTHFYDQLREKLSQINTKLLEYQQFAQEFCSFNNISGKFNDFFIDSIRGQFSEPYPWEEAPLYLASLEALLISSYGSLEVPFTFDNRQDHRQPLDLEFIREIATIQSRHIAPETGDLEQLNDFVDNKFSQLLEYFGRGTGLDESNEIYDQNSDIPDYDAIVQSRNNLSLARAFALPSQIINSYEAGFSIQGAIYTEKRSAALDSPDGLSYTFEEMVAEVKRRTGLVYPEVRERRAVNRVLDALEETYGTGEYSETTLAEAQINWQDYMNYYHYNMVFNPSSGLNSAANPFPTVDLLYDQNAARYLMKLLIPSIQKMQELDKSGILQLEGFYKLFLGASP
jgi:hypothetical protein